MKKYPIIILLLFIVTFTIMVGCSRPPSDSQAIAAIKLFVFANKGWVGMGFDCTEISGSKSRVPKIEDIQIIKVSDYGKIDSSKCWLAKINVKGICEGDISKKEKEFEFVLWVEQGRWVATTKSLVDLARKVSEIYK
jgi:hypothetical protein